MTVQLARRGVTVQIALNTVVSRTTDVQFTTLHQEILVARHSVLGSCQDVYRTVFQLRIVTALDAMCRTAVGIDIQHALALQFQMAFAVETGFGGTFRTVFQRISAALLHAEVNTFAVGDVDGCTIGIGQLQPVDGNRTLCTAVQRQRTVGASSAEVVCYL